MPDGKPERANEGGGLPSDLRFYGTASPSQTHALVLPKRAREELGLDSHQPVFVFGSPSRQHAILAAAPPPADLMTLLAVAASQAQSSKDGR